jgi:hypothetical protein
MDKYDSTKDTLAHQRRVFQLMRIVINELLIRGSYHDNSKLYEPEKSIFDEWTPKLAHSTYGTKEYDEMKSNMKIALDHHYANNTHHPEHYEQGIRDMDLFDLFEMLIDWKASTERHNDGNIYKSITINEERFNMSDDLTQIFINTAKKMGF